MIGFPRNGLMFLCAMRLLPERAGIIATFIVNLYLERSVSPFFFSAGINQCADLRCSASMQRHVGVGTKWRGYRHGFQPMPKFLRQGGRLVDEHRTGAVLQHA